MTRTKKAVNAIKSGTTGVPKKALKAMRAMKTSTIGTLISLQIKAGIRLPQGKSRTRTIMKWVLYLAIAGIMLGAFIALYYMIAKEFVKGEVDLSKEFLIFTLVGFSVIQTLFLIPMLIKVLDINNDRELLPKLPLSSRQIFISKIIVAYIYEILFAAIILFPLLIAYGLACGMAFGFYLLIPLLVAFVPALPFCIAILVLFPIMKVVQYLRPRALLTTIVYFGILAIALFAYMQIIQGMVYAVANEGFGELLKDNASSIKSSAKYFYPAVMFANILNVGTGTAVLNAFGVILSAVVFMGIALVIAGLKYKKFYLTERVTHTKSPTKTLYEPKGATWSVLDKDVKNIFRSSNYTFQFLLIVVVTPFIIYFTNRLASYAAYQAFNQQNQPDSALLVAFEICLLVIMVLIPLASSFAASNISREGNNIYHTKLIPVSFRKQLLIKTGIVFVPILISVTIGCLLSMIKIKIVDGQPPVGLGGVEVLILFVIAVSMAIGYICLGTYMDLRKPLCNQVGSGELTKSTSHINFIIILGIVMGLGFGAFALFSVFGEAFGININISACRITLVCISIAFAATFATLLFVDGPKRYSRLEQ